LENLIIKTPKIQIEPENPSHEVFVIGQNGPTILIDLKGMQVCNIYGLRIANRGFSKVKFREDFENMIEIKKELINQLSPESSKKQTYSKYSNAIPSEKEPKEKKEIHSDSE
jgi:hypothetical protein